MRTTTPLVDVGRALGASVLVAAAILTAPPPVLVQSAQSCVSTQGYWRSHPEAWPAGSLVLGNAANAAHTYNRADLIALMDLPTRRDASLTLADQLIAARLNVARGSSPAPIAQQLARADALFAVFQGRLPYGTAANTPIGTDMVAVARVLDDYNRGAIAGACTPGNRAPTANAGPDQSVTVGRTVTLDGSASLDPDGNPLTFRWVLVTKPADSAAALSDVTAVKPTFIADKRGQYEAQLVVRDGTADSAPDTVAISTVNSQPSAHAGPDQTLQVGSLAPLDGSASTDPDGDALTYSWAFVTKPASSNAALSDPAAVTPTFTVDRPGNYELELTVFDGHVASPVDRVAISTVNSPPEANAGTDTTAAVGDVVTLDGSGSSDRDGDPLTYAWALVSKPAGSLASLSDLAAVEPTIAIDRQGDYVMRLVVHDGTVASESDEVVISTINSRPDANAGADQPAVVGVLLALDGSGSTDVDGDALSYQWSITSRPAGSTANLTNPASVTPTFVPDVAGTYVAQLTVDDGSLNDSDTVTLTTGNRAPVANAGADQSVPLGATAQLDGTASFDPDGNALTYAWSLLTAPAGSVAALSNPASPTPTITTDIDGVYVLQLIVNDGALDSEPSTVTLSRNAKPVADAGANQEVETGATVLLDGRGSSDPDGTALGYSWSLLSRPASSGAALTGANSPTASFVADQDGTYVVQLIVSDGVQSSAPKTITITAASDADLAIAFVDPPAGTHTPGSSVNVNVRVANLGPLDTTSVSARFVLPAGLTRTTAVPSAGTYDVTSGVWTIGALDAGGEAVLQIEASVRNEGATALSAAITASDRRDPNPANDTATAGAINRPPTANAGADRQVTAGASALLDGSGSADPDGDVLAFEWRFTTRPATSTAALTGPTTAGPSFVADRAGLFVAELVVRDPSNAAATDSVSVTAAVNRPPLITSSPLTSGQAGAPYTYAVTAIDPDAGDTLTFSLPIAPAGMTIDSASGLVGWTPTGAQTGINQVAVHVRDRAGLLAAQGFSVEVGTGAGNGAPTAEDDAYDARTGESLSVSAPGVLANDRDPNGNRLRARADAARERNGIRQHRRLVHLHTIHLPGR